ncbi:MAG: helix-turn-helix transcriptional regulator [Flavobacteriales bacterium]|nr:helix-turn-helix transcriptional regulator [Flavobacteriales bacterium]
MGEKLRQFRVHVNYTQEYAAAQLDVSKSTYCEYEKGLHPVPHEVVMKAAKLYNVEPAIFFASASLKLGADRNEAGSLAANNSPELLRSFEEREQKLLEFMKAQTTAMNDQMTMLARMIRGSA